MPDQPAPGPRPTGQHPTGQWLVSQGTRWFFDSGALSLDFAYTGAGGGNPDAEQFHAPVDLGRWLGERFPRLDGDAGERELSDALGLRSAISAVAAALSERRTPNADDVDTINLFAATPDVPPALVGGRRQAGAGRIRIGQALSSVARDAVSVFGHEVAASHRADGEQRIRQCSASDCRLVFYDESRTNNRRWCSMQRCGNRAKVRAFRERTAARSAP
jgi:predicted RNA-binding Zn ribbon-like protein